LGIVQRRGNRVVDPTLVAVGTEEGDYLERHIKKVRSSVIAGGRSLFRTGGHTPTLLDTLVEASTGDLHFTATAKTLQDQLARHMRTSTNASDCVFAAVLADDEHGGDRHVSLLKLDAVLEAAQMKQIQGAVSFRVLKHLLPEPGKLQKALSWPDPRAASDVIMLDSNVTTAQYFENAYEVRVSARSVEAEAEMLHILVERLPATEVTPAVERAAEMAGPLDEVLSELAKEYPPLAAAVAEVASAERPAGMIRRNKVAAQRIVWRANGMELRVSADIAPTIVKQQTPDGRWVLTVVTADEPRRDFEGRGSDDS
jgi:hypothetical protein